MKKEKIEDTLLKIGIPASVQGFRYITQAVLMMDTEEYRNPKFTHLYCEIANINKVTASRVERAIRHAFEIARDVRGDYEMADRYIGFANTSNSASLAQLYLILKREDENEESNA